MKLILYFRPLWAIMLLLIVLPVAAQEKKTFKTVREYLTFAQNEIGVSPEEIYYLAHNPTAAPPKKVSPVMFFRDGQMTIIEDVALAMKIHDSPANLMKLISQDAIRKTMFRDDLATAQITNLINGKTYRPAKGEVIAVILMGQEMSDINREYLNERAAFAKRTGIKTFVITVDENDITEIVKRRAGSR